MYVVFVQKLNRETHSANNVEIVLSRCSSSAATATNVISKHVDDCNSQAAGEQKKQQHKQASHVMKCVTVQCKAHFSATQRPCIVT